MKQLCSQWTQNKSLHAQRQEKTKDPEWWSTKWQMKKKRWSTKKKKKSKKKSWLNYQYSVFVCLFEFKCVSCWRPIHSNLVPIGAHTHTHTQRVPEHEKQCVIVVLLPYEFCVGQRVLAARGPRLLHPAWRDAARLCKLLQLVSPSSDCLDKTCR